MVWVIIVISIIFTLVILALTLFSISKGYDYEHTIDPIISHEENEEKSIDGTQEHL